MRAASTSALLLAGVLAATTLSTSIAPSARAADSDPFTVQTLHFKVTVGPDDDQTVDVVGDLYTPASATADHPAPAILTTNGFGGSKDDQADIGSLMASRGYVVLSYSGLGFGGSGGQITLDDPDYDGKAASQLVSFLGGADGIAYTDSAHTAASPALHSVQLDARDHAGVARSDDPRVGMVGGSYGGQIQFAAASVDKRIDTIVPIITWHDLSYSLAPNNTSQTGPDTVATSVSGAAKLFWALGFSALGVAGGVQHAQEDPTRLFPCPNFATWVCPGLVVAGTVGTPDATTVEHLRHASVGSYAPSVTIPTLLIQGQDDTLFNLNEGIANFKTLRAQGTPVKMIWTKFGHSGDAAPGELSWTDDPSATYVTGRIVDWFDHYLADEPTSTGPLFAFWRDWITYTGNAAPAYQVSATYPVSAGRTFYLSGGLPAGGALVDSPAAVTAGTSALVTPPAGLPTSLDPADVVGSLLPAPLAELPNDAPGTAASWTSAPLTSDLQVAGSPTATLSVSAGLPSTPATSPITLFVKVQDVAPDGSVSYIHNSIAPIRVDPSAAFTVTLPAFVHDFAVGHSVRLVVAGGSLNYRGNLVPVPVTIAGGTDQVLTLPAIDPAKVGADSLAAGDDWSAGRVPDATSTTSPTSTTSTTAPGQAGTGPRALRIGKLFKVSLAGLAAHARYRIYLGSRLVRSGRVPAGRSAAVRVRVPRKAKPGASVLIVKAGKPGRKLRERSRTAVLLTR
ncbi:MAG: CocE/NonD family hydrolase [Nocardioides sp.]|uniref:CocE/NonD family hydrolase n=1 Tax=Nocardioides sp. TaxID=35761 RepID=UPI0039E5BFF6